MDQMGYTRREATRIDIEKVIVIFYNRIAGAKASTITDIPKDPLALLLNMTYEQLTAALIREDSQKGMSCEQLRIKWGLTERKLRRVTGKK